MRLCVFLCVSLARFLWPELPCLKLLAKTKKKKQLLIVGILTSREVQPMNHPMGSKYILRVQNKLPVLKQLRANRSTILVARTPRWCPSPFPLPGVSRPCLVWPTTACWCCFFSCCCSISSKRRRRACRHLLRGDASSSCGRPFGCPAVRPMTVI